MSRAAPGRIARAVVVALGLAAAPAGATQPRAEDRHPTDGVDRPVQDISGEGDASSIELNPALLADVEGLDLTLMGYRTVSNFTRGGGFGGFFAANLGFGLAAGLGVQVVRPRLRLDGADFDAANNPDLTKLSFALAGDFDGAAFGVGVHGVRLQGQRIQRPDLDIGALVRLFNYGSVGLTARLSPVDIDTQALPGHLTVAGELAIRPLGTHHLELAGGVAQQVLVSENGEPAERVDFSGFLPRGRVAVRFQGWALKGQIEQVRASVLDPQSLARLRGEKALRGGVALEASWDVLTVGAGTHAGVSEGLDGVGFSARVHSRPGGRVYWPRPIDADRYELSKLTDERGLVEMLDRLERARLAGERSVVVLDVRGALGPRVGWASLHELREAFIRVRNAGGHVYAYVESVGLRDYYLASAAERIYIHPAGGLDIHGIGSDALYFKGALDKLGVKAEIVRIDEYKSFGERFDRTGPSAADREQREALLDDTYGLVVHDIAQARGVSMADVRRHVDEAPWTPEQAVDEGLVDEIVFRDELLDQISERIGASVKFTKIHDAAPERHWATDPYVAVVLVDDTIVDGRSRQIPFLGLGFTGGDTIAQTLRTLRKDRYCRGVVLRVNSPGGSALASEVIWREVSLTAEAHAQDPRFAPPIVVSMGDVAASGGYYISTAAPTVFADPMTVTGSIGIITAHFDVSGLLETLGIDAVAFGRGKNANVGSPYRPYTDDQRQRVEDSLRSAYDLFRQRVADGRGKTMDEVDQLGRGRVYSGIDAKALGLVDTMGGLVDAVAAVRTEAGVPPWRPLRLRVLPRERTLVDVILGAARGPRERVGAIGRAVQRRQARAEAVHEALPRVLDRSLSRLPMSLLLLPPDQPHALAPSDLTLR